MDDTKGSVIPSLAERPDELPSPLAAKFVAHGMRETHQIPYDKGCG